jgi:hypothetical protein
MPNFEEHNQVVVKRAAAFYQKTEPGHYLISAHIPTEVPPNPPLWEFDLDHQLTKWLDYKLAQDRADAEDVIAFVRDRSKPL